MAKFVCPYCYNTVRNQDVEFRCGNVYCSGMENDIRYQKYLMSIQKKSADKEENLENQLDMPMRKVFRGQRRFIDSPILTGGAMPLSASCPDCGNKTFTRVCPECHCDLPDNFDEVKTFVFGILGVRGVSKSTYIAVALQELQKRLAKDDLNAVFYPAMTEVEDRFKQQYYKPIYVEKRPLKANVMLQNRAADALDFKKPLIFTMKIEKKEFNLVFFDIAGEECLDRYVMSSVAKYIPYTNGLICIIDPLYLSDFRSQINPDIVERCSVIKDDEAKMYNAERLLTDIRSIVTNVSHKEMVHIPTSVAVSKLDIIQMVPDAFPEGARAASVRSEIVKNGIFNMSECNQISSDVKGFLYRYGAGDAVRYLDDYFEKYKCTTFSALGEIPTLDAADDLSVANPHPIRIADSIYYLLHENKII